ncbi:MAG: dTDP-glucose 4,6-dehydratase [Omnitrophica WOR_2 bacterium RIFCSPHIGHO2_02_FULL_45_21]|nr:MAG: dTDP-glucose 4,6-dehydratase [Omnitrophica WOR_2 bacterium RIFCSPHIGHO2_02_FULL_45_21]
MRLLITGGAGFIGSNFIRYILNRYPSYKIINLDILTYAGNLDNLKDIVNNRNYTFVKGDICDEKLMHRLVKKIDVIVNFAASTHVDRSIKDASDFIKTNIYGTFVLLSAAQKSGIKLFFQISTDETYGSILSGRSREVDPLLPNSPYAASKAAGDHLVRSYYVTYKLPIVITRSSNNFGPYQYPEKIIPLFVTNILEGRKVPLYGDGQNRRDWIFVLDNCSAIDCILHKGKVGEIYNIGAGNEITNIVMTKKILKLMKRPQEFIQYVKDRPGHDRRYALDCAKLKGLGWQPKFSFAQALKLTIDWYGNNQRWWKRLKRQS